MTKEIALVRKVEPVAKQAESIDIRTADDMKEAVVILSKLNIFNDKIRTEKEKVTRPLNEALKAERNRWKGLETMYETAIDSLREKMSVYQTAMEQRRKKEELKIVKRVAPGKGNLSLETAVERIDELETVEKEVATSEGLVQFREVKRLKIANSATIPDEYWVVDEKALLEALKAGMVVPGAELETIQVPVNYR